MPQHDYNLADASGINFRTDLNNVLAAIRSGNSDGTTAPTDPVGGMIWVKPVSGTVFQVYRYDGTQWTLLYQVNPTTGKLYNADGVRRQYCGLATGTADVITLSSTPAITAYEDGQRFVFVTSGANTGAVTINVDSVGASACKLEGQDPGAGDLASGALIEVVRYNSLFHVVGGASRNATTSLAGKTKLSTEAQLLAKTAGVVPTSDIVGKHIRERLTANRTYYVRTDGSNSNTGLANSAGGAFLTLQKAWDVIQDLIDLNGWTVTVQVGDGTYTAGVDASRPCVGQDAISGIVFQGNSGTPGNVIISATNENCFVARRGASFNVKDMELRTTTAGDCIIAETGGSIAFSGIRFGACAGRHVEAWGGAVVSPFGAYSIVGNAARHIFASSNGVIQFTGTFTITLTGTPAFSQQFARASNNGTIYCDSGAITFSGAATGKRYEAVQGGCIDTEGGGANYFPGNSAGSVTSPGVYA